MKGHQEALVLRMQEFRKKYYLNKIIRGSLLLALLVSSILFIVLVSEGLFGFSSQVRTAFVFGLALSFLVVLGYMVLWPLSQLFKMTRGINDFQIAEMVQGLFPDINDKLLNLLQLKSRDDYAEGTLVDAAVDKRAAEIAPVKLSNGINLNVNRKYVWYLLVPVLLFLITYGINPSFLSSSSYRLINYNEQFVPPAPFVIQLGTIPEQVVAGEDLHLDVSVEGNELPGELFVFLKKDSESQYMDFNLDRNSATSFSYTISDIKEDFSFYIGNPDVQSPPFEIKVIKRPFIRDFNITLVYPEYTGLGAERLENNVGDFKALKGTRIRWSMEPQGELKDARWIGDGEGAFTPGEEGDTYSYTHRIMRDFEYFISLTSVENIENIDTVKYRASVVQDRYPSIYVLSPTEAFKVGLDPRLPLDLEIGDDFGFTRMSFFYRFTRSGGVSGTDATFKELPLEILNNVLLQPQSYNLDLTQLGISEGDEVEYYIKVWDNDGVSGPKSSTSPTFQIIYPTLGEKYEEVEKKQDAFKSDLEELTKDAENLEESYKKLQEKLLEQRKLSFDDKKELQRMIDEHQQMMDELNQSQEQLEETKEELKDNNMVSEETLEKYDELNKFMEDLENPEIEELLKELEEQLENLDPEDIRERLEQLRMDDEDIRKSLERTLELFKQIEVQQKIDELKNRLDNMKSKEEFLNEKAEQAEDAEELKDAAERQEEVKEQMDEIKEEIDDLKELKEETQTPDEELMEEVKQDAEDVSQEMQEAQEQLEEAGEKQEEGGRQNKKESQQSKENATQKQKNAAQKLGEMSEKLSSMQMEMQMQQDQANLESLRELLENLLKLSFDQEDLRDDVGELSYGDPALGEKSNDQKKLQDDMEMVEDSLEALSRRIVQMQKPIMDESRNIVESMDKSQRFFRNKQIPVITLHQQTAMTSINNLANMLSNLMQQIQQQMMNGMPGGAMSKEPGQQNPNGMQNISEQQRKLNQQLQQMMQQGKMDGRSLAEMAARQQAIREQLEKARQQMQENGQNGLGDLGKVADDMQESEQDMMNKQLTHETLFRQQQILNRLLQADRSMREREWDKKRESQTGRNPEQASPEELSLDEMKNKIRQELLKSNQLEYSNDFIILIEKYFKKLEGSDE